MFSINSSDVVGDGPGLQFVAIAIGTRFRLNISIGGIRVLRSVCVFPGNSTAIVPEVLMATTLSSEA